MPVQQLATPTMRMRTLLCAVPVLGVLAIVALPRAVSAGTTVIHVETEGSGDIIKFAGDLRNLNGAMVWNGNAWVVNNTWAHKFFVDTRTGNRLKSYDGIDATVSGPPNAGEADDHPDGYGGTYPPDTFGNYTIAKRSYWYTKPAASGACGLYRYGSVEYRITDTITGKVVILRSRGVGGGTEAAYFDVYIEDDVTGGGVQTTAFRGDPAWFTYALSGVAALDQDSRTDSLTGDLPGAVTQQSTHVGDYFLDQGGGADLGPAGVGKSFELHTGPLLSRFAPLSQSYITSFELKYMDSDGNLHKITVAPTLFRELFQAGECPRAAAPALGWPALAALAVLLVATGAWRLGRR